MSPKFNRGAEIMALVPKFGPRRRKMGPGAAGGGRE